MEDLTQEELEAAKAALHASWIRGMNIYQPQLELMKRLIAEVERRRAKVVKHLVGRNLGPEWVVSDEQDLILRQIDRPLQDDRLHVLRCQECRESAILQHRVGCFKKEPK